MGTKVYRNTKSYIVESIYKNGSSQHCFNNLDQANFCFAMEILKADVLSCSISELFD
jgi:hypothetical protein